MSKESDPILTPEQSADVIRYYHNGENYKAREHGWKDKVALGQSAMHTIHPGHSILPDNKPPLTALEMKQGLEFITQHPEIENSDIYYEKLDEIVDKRNIPYGEAQKILDEEGLEDS